MNYLPLSAEAPKALMKGAFLALGCFDGLHLGHRALLKAAGEAAAARGMLLGVWSPTGAKSVSKLLPDEQRAEAFRRAGVDFYLEEQFDEIRNLSAERFFYDYLIGRCRVGGLVCGENFTFGRNRAGNSEFLRDLCARVGLPLLVKEMVCAGGETVSSAAIRKALSEGNPEKAETFLGHAYGFFSTVEKGRQVGRALGFPTLNLPLPEQGVLSRGVYLAGVSVNGGECLPAVANIGVHPTFECARADLCEAHLLSTPPNMDPGGQRMYIEFYRFVRQEKKFESAEALKEQLNRDLELAQRFFSIR